MLKINQTVVFIVLQLAVLPLTVAGYFYAAIKVTLYAKATQSSATASSVLGGRWIMHRLGVREDFATVVLLDQLPFVSPIAYNLLLVPAMLAHKITGYIPGMARAVPPEKASLTTLVCSRTAVFDQLFEQAMNEIEQVVVMGAGYDTRLFKYRAGLKADCYELDQASTQGIKRKAFSDAGMDAGWIHFVPVDFTYESWSEKLLESGFDTSRKTFWLWEGVTLYLDETVVRKTLSDMSRLSAGGSRVAFDFYSLAFVTFSGAPILKLYGKQMLKAAGEPFKFGVDTQADTRRNVGSLLAGTDFNLNELILLGHGKMQSFAGIAEAIKD